MARQRAVLILRDVLGWPPEVAAALEMSVATVKSALQQTRTTVRHTCRAAGKSGRPGLFGRSIEVYTPRWMSKGSVADASRFAAATCAARRGLWRPHLPRPYPSEEG